MWQSGDNDKNLKTWCKLKCGNALKGPQLCSNKKRSQFILVFHVLNLLQFSECAIRHLWCHKGGLTPLSPLSLFAVSKHAEGPTERHRSQSTETQGLWLEAAKAGGEICSSRGINTLLDLKAGNPAPLEACLGIKKLKNQKTGHNVGPLNQKTKIN